MTVGRTDGETDVGVDVGSVDAGSEVAVSHAGGAVAVSEASSDGRVESGPGSSDVPQACTTNARAKIISQI
jgi:hypothetical protein